MARVLEDGAKRLLSRHGIETPRGLRAASPTEAADAARAVGGQCVVKALVPIGRRGLAGLVRLCDDPEQAALAATDLLGAQHEGYRVASLLVEALVPIAAERYLSITSDADRLEDVILISARGGVEIESHVESIVRVGVSPLRDLDRDSVANAWRGAGCGDDGAALTEATLSAFAAFRSLDATLLEINPLAVTTSGAVVAVGAMLSIDDLALPRQPEVADMIVPGSDRATRPETELEQRVAALSADASQRGSARYLELEGGDIGFLCGGGGASLLLFDALVAAGGQPANYSEFGGNPTEQRVYDLTRVVLDKPGVRGLFVAHNITNNTQVDVVARGVTRAIADARLPQPFPVVAREVGVNEDDARRVFEGAGVEWLGADVSLNNAARVMVERMNEARQ